MRRNTYLIDIDGTLLKKTGRWHDTFVATPGAVEYTWELDKGGHMIVLVTARPETYREETMRQLKSLGFCFHMLVMGLTNGTRVLIDDKLCQARVVTTDEGFK